jgi:hypothetical protein
MGDAAADEGVFAEGAPPRGADEARASQDAQVLRDRRDVGTYGLGELADAARRSLEQFDDEETRGVGEGLEELSPPP